MRKANGVVFGCMISLLWVGTCFATVQDIETALMNKDYETSRLLATKILRNTSIPQDRTQATYYLALSQLRLGKFADSRKSFSIVMQQSPDNEYYDKAATGLIEGLYLSGYYKDTLKESSRFIDKKPNSSYLSTVYLKMARANLKLMRWQKANEILNKLITDFPMSMETPVARGLLEEKEYFAVQVGAFEDKERAMNLSNELKNEKYYAYIIETINHEQKKFYRVRVGQLTSLMKAKELERRLATIGYPTLITP